MYGLNVPYLTAKHKDICDNAELIVQTAWPHIVARVHRFNRTEREEARRLNWMQRCKVLNLEYAQVEGFRIYLEHIGALQDVGRTYIAQRLGVDGGEYVSDVLNDMCFYIANQLTSGQRFAYDDNLPILPDSHFKDVKAHVRELKRQEKLQSMNNQ